MAKKGQRRAAPEVTEQASPESIAGVEVQEVEIEAVELPAIEVATAPALSRASWDDVAKAARAEPRQVSQVYFPEPDTALLDLGGGINANVLTGEPAYQLSSGEIITL